MRTTQTLLGFLLAMGPLAGNLHAQGPPLPRACIANPQTLCLLDDRVQVTTRWKNQHADGREGVGRAQELNERSGLFWFFSPDNTELILKVIDGTSLNDSLWVFIGALTDVEFWVDVTDTATAQRRTYYNPPGNTYGIADTQAFRDDGVGNFCGGIGGFPCPRDLVCDPDPGHCQVADVGGRCALRPEVCPEIFQPVCGCDGRTYSNDCERLLAGVARDHFGECGASCGGLLGALCPAGEFCDSPPGLCNVADLPGFCVPRGDACPAVYDPVCGCDGETYGNDCERLLAGVTKNHDGECNAVDFCGGFAGFQCPPGLVCDFPPGLCQVADLAGFCVPGADVCPAVLDPVCGCDGRTYNNDCERLRSGVTKDHDGVCAPE